MATVELILQYSTFRNRLDNKPRYRGKAWLELVEGLCKHTERAEKDGPLWSPTVYKGTAQRGNAGVEAITAAVGDFDDGTAFEDVQERFASYEYVVHSTHSHSDFHPKYRVIIPFTQPVPVKDWPDLKARIDEHLFGQMNDAAAKDPARIYYMPACPPRGDRFAEHHEGGLLDPYSLAPSTRTIPKNGYEPTEHDAPTGPAKIQLGKIALDFVANGAPMGEQRSRAVAAARNYLSAGYSTEDTATAIWRGLEASPQDPDRGPWVYDDALYLVENINKSPAPELDLTAAPVPPRAEIHKLGLGYECTFPTEGVRITIDHLYRRSDGLKGEINVQTTVPGVPRDLYSGNFILSTLAARASMSKHLASRSKDSALSKEMWEFILEDFCRKVVQAERLGEPLMRIGTQRILHRPEWLVSNAILANDIGTLYGPGQTGKSRLALAWGLTVLTGKEFVPGFTPTTTGEILYLDWETSEDKLITRCQSLCNGQGMEPVDFWYQPCRGPFVDMYEKTMKDVQQHNIQLVILDSVEAATAGTRDSGADQNAAIMLLYQALRFLNTSVLLIDHVNSAQAGQGEGARKPYGSVFKFNYARYAFDLRNIETRKQPGDEHLVLTCTKYNDGSAPKPVGLNVKFEGVKTTYDIEGAASNQPTASQEQLQMVQAALENGPLPYAEIAKATKLKENAVRAIVSTFSDKFRKDDSRKTVLVENNLFG